jgi:hypothetical protein
MVRNYGFLKVFFGNRKSILAFRIFQKKGLSEESPNSLINL